METQLHKLGHLTLYLTADNKINGILKRNGAHQKIYDLGSLDPRTLLLCRET